MTTAPERSRRAKQFKVWSLMATTLIVGLLLWFGRWSSDPQLPMEFGRVAWGAFPAGWLLAIEYGVLCVMVAAIIHADRIDPFFASPETLIWLAGIGLFTAGLYHDNFYPRFFGFSAATGENRRIWGGSINGYGTVTEFWYKPSLSVIPQLLAVWPMIYGAIAVMISFVTIMGSKRAIFRWRWVLPALFLVTVSATWMVLCAMGTAPVTDSIWRVSSFLVCPAVLLSIVFVRDHERKILWMNLIAALWISVALIPNLNGVGAQHVIELARQFMGHGYRMIVLADLMIVGGSLILLFPKASAALRR
jgi:hypothetical protein